MKTITIGDYIVSVDDNNKITITHNDVDVTSDIVGKNPDIDIIITYLIESINEHDDAVEQYKQLIADGWKKIDKLKADYDSIINK